VRFQAPTGSAANPSTPPAEMRMYMQSAKYFVSWILVRKNIYTSKCRCAECFVRWDSFLFLYCFLNDTKKSNVR
jgi:hypothetical protein